MTAKDTNISKQVVPSKKVKLANLDQRRRITSTSSKDKTDIVLVNRKNKKASGSSIKKAVVARVIANRLNKNNLKEIDNLVVSDDIISNAKLAFLSSKGIPVDLLESRPQITSMMVEGGVLPRKTMEDAKKKPKGNLSPMNSERFIRVLRLEEKAKDALGDEVAIRWMEKPNKNFDGLTAMQMAKTESGARAVEQFLGQLAHGFNA